MAKKQPRQRTALVQLKIRMREPLRTRLEHAASVRGESINAEVIGRVEYTFDRSDLLVEVLSLAFGSQRLAGLLIMLGFAMHDQGRRISGKSDWTSDSVAYDAAVLAAMRLLDFGRPDGSRASALDRNVAAQGVDDLIQVINDGGTKAKEVLGDDPRGDAILRLTGPIAKRMSEALARMRGQFTRQVAHSRSSSRKAREAS
jgi:hypothetical protein